MIGSARALLILLLLLTLSGAANAQSSATAQREHVNHAALKQLGWQLAVSSDAAGDRPLDETLEILHKLTVHHVELRAGTLLSTAGGTRFEPTTTVEMLQPLIDRLKVLKMDVVSVHVDQLDDATVSNAYVLAGALHSKILVAGSCSASAETLAKLSARYSIRCLSASFPDASNIALSAAALVDPHLNKAAPAEARLDGDAATNSAAVKALKDRQFTGIVCVDPAVKSVESLTDVLDHFADALENVAR